MPKNRARLRTTLVVSGLLAVALAGGGFAAKPVIGDYMRCQQIEADQKDRGLLVPVAQGSPLYAVLGDSYTSGDVLGNRKDAWVYQLKNVGVVAWGSGGSGFVNQGPCHHQAYDHRIGLLLGKNPDVLVIQGGLNDSTKDPRDVELAARMLLRESAGVKKVIVVGPTNAPALTNLPAIDAALKRATEAEGRKYVSALNWDLEFGPDRLHLTPAGHKKFAALVQTAV